jgi:hypothetical protein
MMSAVLGIWDLMVACKGSVVVAWRRGSLRSGLVGLVAAVAMLATVGGLWVLAGNDGAQDAAAPGGRAATPDPGDADGEAAGGRGAGPANLADPRSSDARGTTTTTSVGPPPDDGSGGSGTGGLGGLLGGVLDLLGVR